jgi:aromatic-L-amino-acid/L-tryptophan decarboxylase
MGPHHSSFDLADDDFRRLGREVIELMLEALTAEISDPVLRQASGADIRAPLDEPLPEKGAPAAEVVALWRDAVLPYCRRNGHPRFFGYVCTSADPLGMLAEAMASAVNQPVTAWRSAPSATEVERLAVRWLNQLVGFGGPADPGILVSGGSAANLHCLACAVTRAESRAGLPPGSRARLTIYMSREAHVSMRKAGQILGLPPDQVRLLGVDERRRLRMDELTDAVERDRERGLVPAAVCASAGTANTGAIDPLAELAGFSEDQGVWLHIDGAYGAPAVLTNSYSWMAEAFSRADSMSLDPHKWLFAPADAGCALVRDEEAVRQAFTLTSEYTTVTQTDPIERYAFFDNGIEMSRRFRGLKVWTILKARGVGRIRAAIQHDIELRRRLDERIEAEHHLESLGSELSIACFRYRPEGADTMDEVNRANRTILETLVHEGHLYMSPTELDGRYALRVCIVNFRTQPADIDFLVDEVLRLGSTLT